MSLMQPVVSTSSWLPAPPPSILLILAINRLEKEKKLLKLISSSFCYFNCVNFVFKYGSLGKTEYVYYTSRDTQTCSLEILEAKDGLHGKKMEKEQY